MGRVFIFGFLILVLSACSSYKEDELVVFDTEASYPEREILLSEVCDVTYVPLDNVEVVGGRPRLVTDQFIIYSNRESDLLFFDRQGRFVRKFNHREDQAPVSTPISVRLFTMRHRIAWLWHTTIRSFIIRCRANSCGSRPWIRLFLCRT